MKLIFSRKGFDSTAGGMPSPLYQGRPFSLPIPTRLPSVHTFGDLFDPLPAMIQDLSARRIALSDPCHLDPDLDAAYHPGQPQWRGALGQAGAAQGHLRRQGVAAGDLFLFWGLFREVDYRNGKWRFTGRPEHRIWGWLLVDEVLAVGTDPRPFFRTHGWARRHPHMQEGWRDSTNTVYVGAERLDSRLARVSGLRGWGVFPRGFRLTAADARMPSVWEVPDWLNPAVGGTGMTYHPAWRWTERQVRAAARGQEFVADVGDSEEALAWLERLFN